MTLCSLYTCAERFALTSGLLPARFRMLLLQNPIQPENSLSKIVSLVTSTFCKRIIYLALILLSLHLLPGRHKEISLLQNNNVYLESPSLCDVPDSILMYFATLFAYILYLILGWYALQIYVIYFYLCFFHP